MAGSEKEFDVRLSSGRVARINARWVRDMLKGKVDPDLLKALEAVAEEQTVLKQQLLDLAMLINRVQDNVTQLADVIGLAVKKIDAVKRHEGMESEYGTSPRSE